jgi:threonine synthase
MPVVHCTICGSLYPDKATPFRCEACGGIFDFDSPFSYLSDKLDLQKQGLWRYRHSFALPEDTPPVSLGEGNTPLVQVMLEDREVLFKLEYLNPTGSYKDRGTAILINQLIIRNVSEAVEDSSGNAGASFAAYAARAGIHARIYVPESASGPKRTQIEMFGAELISVPGPRSAAADAVNQEAIKGIPYASHAYMPFGLAGIATIAYEIFEELGQAPGSIIAPVGHGGLLLGIMRGFSALEAAGLIKELPFYLGVQAAECSPIVESINHLKGAEGYHGSGETIAEGVKVWKPVRGQAIIDGILEGKGDFLAITEESILPAYHEMSRLGFYVEPTSALAYCGLKEKLGDIPEPIVVILTGSGLKFRDT